MNRIPGVQGVLDQLEDLIGVPSLAMQLEWHRRNPTAPEPEPEQVRAPAPWAAGMSQDMERVSGARGTLSGAVGVLNRHYVPQMQRQLENSRQLFEGIQRDQELQNLRYSAGMNPFVSQRDTNRALGLAAYNREFAHVGAPATEPQRRHDYFTADGRFLKAVTGVPGAWADDEGNVLHRLPTFPEKLPK